MARHELCLYDRISLGVVGALSVAMVVSGATGLLYVASYAAFGLLWLGSVPTREPLCAAYVKYGYGGEDALANPIFMRANRILAAAWGVLYLLIALWTALLGDAFAGWVLPRCQQCGHGAHGCAHRLVRAPLPGVGCLGQGPARAVLGLGRGWRADWGGVCVRCLRYHVFYRIKLA